MSSTSDSTCEPLRFDGGLRVGLISDTHFPSRLRMLPPRIRDLFRDVDLIIHAGDVGKLSFLSDLETIAPVIAVHGNDEPPATVTNLPFEREIYVNEVAILVAHGHDQVTETEWALRREGFWSPKLDYWAGRARAHDADILIYGHTHVPTAQHHDGVFLINPGALSSGSYFCRQSVPTVAVTEFENQGISVQHFNALTGEPVNVALDLDRSFDETMMRFHTSMYDEALRSRSQWIREELYPITPDGVISTIESFAEECWFGDRSWVTSGEFLQRLIETTRPESRSQVVDLVGSISELATALF